MRRRLNQKSGKGPAARQLDNDTRIEEINCSMLSTLEEENETDLSRSSNPIDTYKLQSKFIFAAENKSYGLQDIENIDANQVATSDVSFHKAILKCTPKKAKRKSAKGCTVSFENQEYFQQTVVEPTQVVVPRQTLKYADLLDIAQQVAVGMVSLQIIFENGVLSIAIDYWSIAIPSPMLPYVHTKVAALQFNQMLN